MGNVDMTYIAQTPVQFGLTVWPHTDGGKDGQRGVEGHEPGTPTAARTAMVDVTTKSRARPVGDGCVRPSRNRPLLPTFATPLGFISTPNAPAVRPEAAVRASRRTDKHVPEVVSLVLILALAVHPGPAGATSLGGGAPGAGCAGEGVRPGPAVPCSPVGPEAPSVSSSELAAPALDEAWGDGPRGGRQPSDAHPGLRPPSSFEVPRSATVSSGERLLGLTAHPATGPPSPHS
jgi:hypothetical protein